MIDIGKHLREHEILKVKGVPYLDTRYVNSAGDESIAGVKTFTSFPVTPSSAPTTNFQMANKKYVDDEIAGIDLSAYVEVTGDIMTGDLGLQDDVNLYFDTAKAQNLKYSSSHGYLYFGGTDQYLTFLDDFHLVADTGADAGGSWLPEIYTRSNFIGLVAPAGVIIGDGSGPSAILKIENIATSDKTFQFPNASGTLAILETAQLFTATQKFGDADNYFQIGSDGVVSLVGTAKRDLTLRASIDYVPIIALTKPTQIAVGIFRGFSMPIWNDGVNSNEQLFFNENVPGRWDGASDIKFHVLVALASAETAGETFKFQFSWNQVGETEVIPATTNGPTDEIIVVDGTQYATYMLEFTIDYNIDAEDLIIPHDDLVGRLRRVASTGDEVDGEVIVLDWHTHYQVDKIFKAPE